MTIPCYASVTVTWNPEIAVLERQLASLHGAALAILVDNASAPPAVAALRRLVTERQVLLPGVTNRGLAAGLNAGARIALSRMPQCEYLLFLDQDTEPGPGGADRLIQTAAGLQGNGGRAGLVGPLIEDATTGLLHGIHVIRGWRWTRRYAVASSEAAVPCGSINGSGMVVPVDVFRALGGFDEPLFIDHVDSEYCFRAAAAGYPLHTIPSVRFRHRMGERSLRFWLGGWRVWPHRSASRHYYLFRNAVLLMRRAYVPRVWKVWGVTKLALTALVHAVIDPARGAQLRAMASGVRAGLRGEGGASQGGNIGSKDAV